MDLSKQVLMDAINRPHIVFISHTGMDSDYIKREIVPVLREQNFDIHLENKFSRHDFRISSLYEEHITRSLNRCWHFVVVLSSASVVSEWVKYEVDLALARKSKKQIIPLIIADCDPSLLNPKLCKIKAIDFRENMVKAKLALAKIFSEYVWRDAT